MVKLTSIVTKTGDTGETGLGGGQRVAKSSDIIDAMGAVDEANAAIGVAVTLVDDALKDTLTAIQNDLFDLGADLCRIDQKSEDKQLSESYVARLDQLASALNQDLSPLTSFILPGGTPAAAHLHMARTLVRKAERAVWQANTSFPITKTVPKYLNRLSDVLFLMARKCNSGGQSDVLWRPRQNE